jgi:hypothetical protein
VARFECLRMTGMDVNGGKSPENRRFRLAHATNAA